MKWLCEYSVEQKCFHVAPVQDCLVSNIEILVNGHLPQFVPVGEFASREDAILFSNRLRQLKPEAFG